LLVTAYYDGPEATPEQRDAVIADVGRVVASLVGATETVDGVAVP
jgi:hypothetical protein